MGWQDRLNAALPERASRWLLLGALLAHLALAAVLSLSPDEAHYAVYGSRPDWSYFDHPPLVGWIQWPALALGGAGIWWAMQKKTSANNEITVEPILQTDEARLSHAINLLKDAAKLETAIKRLELVSSSPDLTPDLHIWSAISLGTAWALKGDLDGEALPSVMRKIVAHARAKGET
jgi:hypothetical protein